MDENLKKELFSKAFVKALATEAGLRSSEPEVDDDSVYIIVRGRGYKGKPGQIYFFVSKRPDFCS